MLLTGATGFVGQRLYPALVEAGCEVRCASRRPDVSRRARPDRPWVAFDLDQPQTLPAALAGCDAAFYLVHGMGEAGDYQARERRWALAFREAAARAGLRRIVYLGGVAPAGKPSLHLASRLATGEVLRAGPVPTIELRASMIIGAGSASWELVRDLAVRLPAMVLPRWLRNRSSPVAIADVVAALVAALDLPLPGAGSVVLDVPGPETLTHRELLRRVAALCGTRPIMIDVPFVSPTLSSYWITLVTRANPRLARELVQGLRADLLPAGEGIWALLPGHRRLSFAEAAHRALLEEKGPRGAASRLYEALAHAVALRATGGGRRQGA